VKKFFKDNDHKESIGENAFHYYNDNDWKNKDDKQVKNWKNQMRNNWFSEKSKNSGIKEYYHNG
jgi:hypothetical protein